MISFSSQDYSFYRLVHLHHPDKSHNVHRKKESEEKIKRLIKAYEILKARFEKN